MFEYYGNIHVYCPGVWAYEPLGPFFFQNHEYLVLLPISCKIFTSNDFFKVFPIPMHWPCRKIGQGHNSVMIYIHIVVLQPLVLHAKFL